MDIQAIVKELKRERDRLDRAISALGDSDLSSSVGMPTPVVNRSAAPSKRRGHLTPEGRKRLSEMMKKRWAERRKKSSRSGR